MQLIVNHGMHVTQATIKETMQSKLMRQYTLSKKHFGNVHIYIILAEPKGEIFKSWLKIHLKVVNASNERQFRHFLGMLDS